MFMGPRNWCQGINSASLCSLAGRYENPIPPRCLAPIDFLKIPALYYCKVLGKFSDDCRDKIKSTETKFLALTGWYCIVDNGIGLPASQRSPAGPVRQPNAMVVYIRDPLRPFLFIFLFSFRWYRCRGCLNAEEADLESWETEPADSGAWGGQGQESMSRNRFRQPKWSGGPVRQPCFYRVLQPRCP